MQIKGAIGPAYKLSSYPLDSQRCVNLYPEPDELQTGKNNVIGSLVRCPGLTRKVTLPTSKVRGIYTVSSNGTVYAVGGNMVYKVASDFTVTNVGTIRTDSGAVSMSDNGLQLIIVDGLSGYILELDNSNFTEIQQGAFYSSNKVIFQDGYFILAKPNTGQFYLSNPYDGTMYNGLNFATAEGSPDLLVSILPFKNQLVLFGSNTTEFWYDTGSLSFPYSRIPGGLIEHGCIAPLSVAKTGDILLWLGQNDYGQGIVYKAVGTAPSRASNYGVELAIKGYGTISDANAFVYQDGGHTFYVLNFPTANATWVLDVDLGTWHERQSVSSDGSMGRWRANCHTSAYGYHLVGDYQDGRIYALDSSNYTDDGATQKWLRTFPPIAADLKRASHYKLQLDCLMGQGTDGTQLGQQPTVMMRYSDDGGASWSSEKWQPLGRLGQRMSRAIWRRLGASRSRVYEVSGTDPVAVAIIGADIDIVGLAS